jgi:hypothetical protein
VIAEQTAAQDDVVDRGKVERDLHESMQNRGVPTLLFPLGPSWHPRPV